MQYQTSAYGAVDGVHPVWGDFTLTYKGNTTAPIRVDATATEVETALENLPQVGDVAVRSTKLGQCLGAQGEQVFPNTSRISVWEITFEGRCALKDWDFCPDSLGDVDLLLVDVSGLEYHLSPHVRQVAPRIYVSEAIKGTTGNLLTRSQGDEIIELSAKHVQIDDVYVGMYETQKFRCASTSGSFSLSMLRNKTGLWEVTPN